MALFRDDPDFRVASLLGPPMETRLEPQSVSGDPATGLRAQVWDPLWMLARQWQLGELAGEDTGTPLTVRVRANAEPLVAWRPGPGVDPGWQPLPPGVSLEELVHAETSTAPSARELALAGWALLETLEDLGEHRAAEALLDHCGPAPDPPGPARRTAELPDPWAPVAGAIARRSLDLDSVLTALSDEDHRPAWWRAALTPGAGGSGAELAASQWVAWVRAELLPPTPHEGSWVGPRLEHGFAVATPTRVLAAPAHAGGAVSWSTFDVETRPGLDDPPASDTTARALDRTLVATPLEFPGMPAARFWELEDGRVDLGSVWADPHELARLLVVECALVHGGDWLVVPLDVPAGSVVDLVEVGYTDTFGTTWVVDTVGADTPRWRMFAVTASNGSQPQLTGLVVPPACAGHVQGPPLEDVGFLRDESANLVWALEHLVPGPGGDPVTPRSSAPPTPADQEGEVVLGYSLMTDVPETWTPYLPRIGQVAGDADAAVTLVRGHVQRVDEAGNPADVEPSGTLLAGDEHRRVESAEVPREGVRVQRVPVVARRGDGTWASWTARRVLTGRGEGESGLRFDLATPPRS